MRKRLLPWLVFFLAVLVPTSISLVYAVDSYRKDLRHAGDAVERGRLEAADEITREIEMALQHAKAVVKSIPRRTDSIADAEAIVLAGMSRYAENVVDPGPAIDGQPAGHPIWLRTTFTDDGLPRHWVDRGTDIVIVRQIGARVVGIVFRPDTVEREATRRLEWRGYGLERAPAPASDTELAPPQLAAVAYELDPKASRIVGRGQVVLDPHAVWNVVVRDAGKIQALEQRSARATFRMRTGATALFLVIALVLFVRGQRQQRLADLRTDYVAAVSHELRTPLASVRMFSELLEAEMIPAGERREVELSLANEARRLHATLERMLRFGALSRGRLSAERAPTALRPLLDAAAAHGGSRFVVEADPEIEASVDAGLLGHALDNLVGNANKYAPEGPVVLRARRDGADIVVDVVDRGPGLGPGARRKIWRPFERADDRLSKATQGTGVGLALVAGIARAHGGKAVVTSTPGAGATFSLRFPQKG